MRLPKLIATDIDGTLVPENQIIPEYTKQVIDRARSEGITFMLATGRQPYRAKLVFDQVNHDGVAICSNGAMLLDTKTMTPVYEALVPKELFPEMFDKWQAAIPGVNIYAEYLEGNLLSPNFDRAIADELAAFFDIYYAKDIMDIFDKGVLKLVLCCTADHLVTQYTDVLKEIVAGKLTVTRSSKLFLEVSQLGVTKQTALQVYCEREGIAAEDVLAFGDMPNDAEMLGWVGHSVAMGDSNDDLKALATGVTGVANEEGVAKYIEAILDGKIAF